MIKSKTLNHLGLIISTAYFFLCFRVYDNARAIALMQKAITIMSYEESLGVKAMNRFLRDIHENYAPKVEHYDGDKEEVKAEDLQKITGKIKVWINFMC